MFISAARSRGSTCILVCFCCTLPLCTFGDLKWPGCGQEVLGSFPDGWPTALDWGLYWFSARGRPEKALPGHTPNAYDPTKHTVIYLHGWMGEGDGSTLYCYRPSPFCDPDVCEDSANMLQAWFDNDWNVGFFYWDQFADEPCSRDAEQKIWFDHGDNGLRWASYDVQKDDKSYQHDASTFEHSVSDLCASTLQGALGNFSGVSLRLVGHSIGAQLAANCGEKLLESGTPAKPTRITMLDPIFTERHLGETIRCGSLSTSQGIGDYASKATTDRVEKLLDKGVPTEIYKSSMYSENKYMYDPNDDLQNAALQVEYKPDWCNSEGTVSRLLKLFKNADCKHKAAAFNYFTSMGLKPPRLTSSGGIYAMPGACVTPSASCQDIELVALAKTRQQAQQISNSGGAGRWVQVEGTSTRTLDDDKFSFESWAGDVENIEAAKAMASMVAASAPSMPDTGSSGGLPIKAAKQSNTPLVSTNSASSSKRAKGDDQSVVSSLKSKWKHMPGAVKIGVVLLGTMGLMMFCYGVQPLFLSCCYSARDHPFRNSSFDSDGGLGDSGSEFEDYANRRAYSIES